jgi:hypothetical protein
MHYKTPVFDVTSPRQRQRQKYIVPRQGEGQSSGATRGSSVEITEGSVASAPGIDVTPQDVAEREDIWG